MSWRLILWLALFGLAMAIASVYVIPAKIETLVWTAIVLICALVVARRAQGRFFLHGFLVGLANWVSVAGAHVILSGAYFARHAREMSAMPKPPDAAMEGGLGAILGPLVEWMRHYAVPVPGASGILIGLLAWSGSKFLRPKGTGTAQR